MVWQLSILFLSLDVMLGLGFYFTNPDVAIVYLIGFFFIAPMVLYLYKTKNSTPFFYLFSYTIAILCHITFFTLPDTDSYANMIWITDCVIFMFIGSNRLQSWIFVILNIIGIILYSLFGLKAHFEQYVVDNSPQRYLEVLELIIGFIVMGFLMNKYITFQNQANNELEEVNDILHQNKDDINILNKEIHHRVKNNLQVIISLLKLQRDDLKSEEAKSSFADAINRMLSISLIHTNLYDKNEVSHIDITRYINDLANDLIRSSTIESNVALKLQSSIKEIDLNTIVPFGLILNELITNSFKYTFNNANAGIIEIGLHYNNDNEIVFEYNDHGTWKESDSARVGFGTELISLLTKQLNGTLNKEGNKYTFKLKPL
jgi:two-component sensor histidine kinase